MRNFPGQGWNLCHSSKLTCYATRELLGVLAFTCQVFFLFFFCFFCFLGPHLRHMEVPRLGVELEQRLLAYTTATVTWDRSYICNLLHSSRQCRIPNSLIKARDWTRILMDASWISFRWATMGTPQLQFLNEKSCLVGMSPLMAIVILSCLRKTLPFL